jgi:valyl-tRNA synthetase
VLATTLETTLRLLHPFAPFVTEEIWQKLPHPQAVASSVMASIFPKADPRWVDADAEAQMSLVQDITVAIRMLRTTYNVPPSWSVPVEVRVPEPGPREILERHRAIVENAARVTLTLTESGGAVAQSAKAVVGAHAEVVMALAGLIDIEAEKARIAKDITKVDKEIATLEKKLANESFVARAPEDVVAEQRARLGEEQTKRRRLEEALQSLQ